jgi:hypothetical protein
MSSSSNNRTLTFSLTSTGMVDFANLVAALNQAGVPFGLNSTSDFIEITISRGY